MKKREPVRHIMSSDPYTIAETETLHDAVHLIRKHKIRHLPVVNGKEISGIISSSDINRLTFGKLFDNQDGADEAVLEMLSIPQVMSKNVKTVAPDDTIKEVAEIFATKDFHSLPVVEDGKLVGIVTTTDIIKYLLDQY
ncbi:MAG TPA: CBS domain-containing protein [Flavipsychrobacter sp.]|nr:CBS domain-containing protein [Flavipsychrobacter sp.]